MQRLASASRWQAWRDAPLSEMSNLCRLTGKGPGYLFVSVRARQLDQPASHPAESVWMCAGSGGFRQPTDSRLKFTGHDA